MQNRLSPSKIIGIATLLLALALGSFALLSGRSSPTGSGIALVGGPFTMVNQRGETVTEKTFLGKPLLVFFGFTTCPDICPTELQVMMAALENLGADGKDIQPLLVTVDPARDTPEVMAGYVSNFGENLTGLTGSDEQVATITQAYRVHYEKQKDPKNPENYTMDHSAIIYLMGPDGLFLKHFSYTTDAKALATGIKLALSR